MRLKSPAEYSDIIKKIQRKFKIGPDIASRVIQYASDRGDRHLCQHLLHCHI